MVSAVLAAALLALSAGAGSAASPGNSHSDSLTSLYLYNFLLFVDWPEDDFRNRNTLVIGLLDPGDGGRLLAGIDGKRIRGKTLVIHRIRNAADLGEDRQVLLIQNAPRSLILEVLSRLGSAPCLTVSNIPGFAGLGGMVELVPPRPSGSPNPSAGEAARPAPRFRINLDAVLDAGLKIRSRLLRLSEITGDIPNGTPIQK